LQALKNTEAKNCVFHQNAESSSFQVSYVDLNGARSFSQLDISPNAKKAWWIRKMRES
jgi:hypothetical protein